MNPKLLIIIATVLWGVWTFATRKAVGVMPPLCNSVIGCVLGIGLGPF